MYYETLSAHARYSCTISLAQLEHYVHTGIVIRIYIRELAHARPPMSSISLVIVQLPNEEGDMHIINCEIAVLEIWINVSH